MPTHPAGLPIIGGDGLATTGLSVPAESPPLPTVLSATSWVVADLDSGDVVGACAPHEYGAPASLQKLLLALAVLPRLDPEQLVTITAEDLDFEPGSSSVGLLLDGQYTVETLWLGLFLNSGNDAANVLARLGGGDDGMAGTLRRMNAAAREIGALDTHAETPHGLDGPGQVTSAYDLALITRALFEREDFTRYVATLTADIPAQPQVDKPPAQKQGFQIQNDNRLLTQYPGALGGKTGFTDIARHTFVGAAERDGRRLVVTLLGAEHQPVRTWQQAAALLDWGFATSTGGSVGHLVEPGEADRLVAAALATPTAAPDGARGMAQPAASNRQLILGAGVAGALFLGVWVFVLLLVGRRRARRRGAAEG
jgi:D-alanyl-D-alanine carboxypeptidase (penicillin-binding protein 5/6)